MAEKAKVKGSAINHLQKILTEWYGEEFWDELLNETFNNLNEENEGFLDSSFYSLAVYQEIIRLFHEKKKEEDKNYELCFEAGRENAKVALSSTYKIMMKFLSIENIMKKAPRLYSRYYTKGDLSVEVKDNKGVVTLKGVKSIHPFDYYNCGYYTQVGMMAGVDVKKVKHCRMLWENGEIELKDEKLTKCIAEGDDKGVFVLEF